MKLIVFAHPLEAMGLLKNENCKAFPFIFQGVYKFSEGYVLLTGEGIQSASESLAGFLGAHHEEINEIINLGVCGLLNEKYEKYHQELVEVRSSYLCLKDHMEFKSFELNTQSDLPLLDCVTHSERIHKTELRPFGHLIDRELWALASVAKKFRKKMRSIKVISDIVNQSSDQVCELVKENAETFSEKLYEWYLKDQKKKENYYEDILPSSDHYFFSFSQKKVYQKIINTLKIRKVEDRVIKSLIQKFMDKDMDSKKRRASLLIEELDRLAHPLKYKMEEELSPFKKHFKKIGAQAHFDKDLEKRNIKISMELKSEEDFIKLSETLKTFPQERWDQFLSGEFRV